MVRRVASLKYQECLLLEPLKEEPRLFLFSNHADAETDLPHHETKLLFLRPDEVKDEGLPHATAHSVDDRVLLVHHLPLHL